VTKGQILLTMNTMEQEKKYNQAKADEAKYEAQAAKAYSDALNDRTKMGDYAIAKAEAYSSSVEANLDLFYINEGTIRAPRDGMILTGDFEDQDNVMKKQGDELFTFQASGAERAEMFVSEADIQDVVQFGTKGELATTSLPRDKYPFYVTRINPQGDARDNSNVFRVFATVPDWKNHPEWLPGMEGQANIDIQQRRLIWIWTHKFIDYVRLKAWTWL
jgi:multidrug efflux pump subunit AcrA (membrane-fusion protein)